MGRPSLWYKDDKEQMALQLQRDAVVFDAPTQPSFMFLIAAPWGEGKTHLACTASELGPVYFVDTEYRAHHVIGKFKSENPIRRIIVKDYMDMVLAVLAILKQFKPPGTIVIDSASDMQQFAEVLYLERAGKDKVGLPRNWGDVYALMDEIYDRIKFSGFNCIFTARVKEQYSNDKPTGVMIPHVSSKFIYKMDYAVQYPSDPKKPVLCLKNGATGNKGVTLTKSMTVAQIIKACQDTPYQSE